MEAPIETHRSRMLFSLEKSLWNRYNQFALSIKSNKNDDRMHRAYRTFSAKVMGTGGGGWISIDFQWTFAFKANKLLRHVNP